MANALTTGAWLSAPTKASTKIPFFTRLWRAHLEARQRHADRVVAQYLALHGNKFTDDAEREIERLLFRAGR
jgi:hypothetical protein